jgi:hypothetical protein
LAANAHVLVLLRGCRRVDEPRPSTRQGHRASGQPVWRGSAHSPDPAVLRTEGLPFVPLTNPAPSASCWRKHSGGRSSSDDAAPDGARKARALRGDLSLAFQEQSFRGCRSPLSTAVARIRRRPADHQASAALPCLFRSPGSLWPGAGLGQINSGNSSLSPGACRAGARPPNWPYGRLAESVCPGPSILRWALLRRGRERLLRKVAGQTGCPLP